MKVYWKYMMSLGIGLCLSACELGERLDVKDMGESPGYFIECYCSPGEMFELTATRIAPVAEPQLLDYSLSFEVYICAGEWFRLNHSLFTRPGTYFMYNYASSRRLDREMTDSVYLDITAPDGQQIIARTAIPEPVQIDTAFVSRQRVEVAFTTSVRPEENFYVLNVLYAGKGILRNQEFFLSGYEKEQQVVFKNDFYEHEMQDSVIVTLRRMTREGYKYQYSLYEAKRSGEESLFAPVELSGNLSGALGVFTCYTIDRARLK